MIMILVPITRQKDLSYPSAGYMNTRRLGRTPLPSVICTGW